MSAKRPMDRNPGVTDHPPVEASATPQGESGPPSWAPRASGPTNQGADRNVGASAHSPVEASASVDIH